MALKTNYVDYVTTSSRKFKMTTNSDGTITLTDVTPYTTIGDNVGASDLNAITQAIVGVTLSGIDSSTYAFAQGIVYLCDSTCTGFKVNSVSHRVIRYGDLLEDLITSGDSISHIYYKGISETTWYSKSLYFVSAD